VKATQSTHLQASTFPRQQTNVFTEQFYYGLGEKKGIAWAPWGPKAPCPPVFPFKTTTKLMNISENVNCSVAKFTAALEIVAFRTLWMGCSDVVDGCSDAWGAARRILGVLSDFEGYAHRSK
jgi:hypothetical protein